MSQNTSASGLSITFGLRCSNLVINITNTTARHNVGYAAGNFEIISYSSSITNSVYITQCVLEDGLVTGGTERGAGGLSIISELCHMPGTRDVDVSCTTNSTVHKHYVVTVTNTTFVNNTAVISGALVVSQQHCANVCAIRIMKFDNCDFTNNTSTKFQKLCILLKHPALKYMMTPFPPSYHLNMWMSSTIAHFVIQQFLARLLVKQMPWLC